MTDKTELVDWLRRASIAIYLATDESVADDISTHMRAAVDRIQALEAALRPFAEAAERLQEACWEPDEEVVLVSLDVMVALVWEDLDPDLNMTDFAAAATVLERDA